MQVLLQGVRELYSMAITMFIFYLQKMHLSDDEYILFYLFAIKGLSGLSAFLFLNSPVPFGG
jgi:hypothetical protein